MAAQKYKISLQVLKNISEVSPARREILYLCNVLFVIKTPMKYQTNSKGAICIGNHMIFLMQFGINKHL